MIVIVSSSQLTGGSSSLSDIGFLTMERCLLAKHQLMINTQPVSDEVAAGIQREAERLHYRYQRLPGVINAICVKN